MSQTSNIRIFLIDDDIFCLTLYRQLLNRLGYTEVSAFTSGSDCLEHLDEQPDLVLADYNMEGMNGIEVMKRLKLHDPSTIVYIISGQENQELAETARANGAADYIVKSSLDPESMRVLMEKVETLIPTRERTGKKTLFKKLKAGLGF